MNPSEPRKNTTSSTPGNSGDAQRDTTSGSPAPVTIKPPEGNTESRSGSSMDGAMAPGRNAGLPVEPAREPTQRDLDSALDASFPASDPIALSGPGEADVKPTPDHAAAAPKRPGADASSDDLQLEEDKPSPSADSGD